MEVNYSQIAADIKEMAQSAFIAAVLTFDDDNEFDERYRHSYVYSIEMPGKLVALLLDPDKKYHRKFYSTEDFTIDMLFPGVERKIISSFEKSLTEQIIWYLVTAGVGKCLRIPARLI